MVYDVVALMQEKRLKALEDQEELRKSKKQSQLEREEALLQEIVNKLDQQDFLISENVVFLFFEAINRTFDFRKINEVVRPYNLCVMEVDDPFMFIGNGEPTCCLPFFPIDWYVRKYFFFEVVNSLYDANEFSNVIHCYVATAFENSFLSDGPNVEIGFQQFLISDRGRQYFKLLKRGVRSFSPFAYYNVRGYLIDLEKRYNLQFKSKV
ncbi:hypothetical protein BBG03_03360 [Streptococcus dysgalactiae subsp. equisimilis]|uniref:hypothetical protein n=1 Tax=Streptococcus dysgalactiae TaxID=1334 RepID=UPI000806FF46|nr:hypothetical protein [Streptococcus dysgalactiae]OBZ00633.1 hypothetical protein BBG03_03360 [Streptococcus dysgalactiae subsp. equisimilis]